MTYKEGSIITLTPLVVFLGIINVKVFDKRIGRGSQKYGKITKEMMLCHIDEALPVSTRSCLDVYSTFFDCYGH